MRASSVLVPILTSCRWLRRGQEDKPAKEGPASASGRHGAEGQLAKVRAQGEPARGLLACWATLRKPNHIRSQEFPGTLHPETMTKVYARAEAAL